MGEAGYNKAHRAGYVLGFGDGKREGLDEGLSKAKDEFWCGFCVAIATWPIAIIAYLALRVWRVF